MLELCQVVVGIERPGRRLQLVDCFPDDDRLEGLLAESHLPVDVKRLIGAFVRSLDIRGALGDAIAVEPGEGAFLRIGELDLLAGICRKLLEELAAAEGDDDLTAGQSVGQLTPAHGQLPDRIFFSLMRNSVA